MQSEITKEQQNAQIFTGFSVGMTLLWASTFAILTVMRNVNPSWGSSDSEKTLGVNTTISPAEIEKNLKASIQLGNIIYPVAGAVGLLAGILLTKFASKKLSPELVRQAIGGGILYLFAPLAIVVEFLAAVELARSNNKLGEAIMLSSIPVSCFVFFLLIRKLCQPTNPTLAGSTAQSFLTRPYFQIQNDTGETKVVNEQNLQPV